MEREAISQILGVERPDNIKIDKAKRQLISSSSEFIQAAATTVQSISQGILEGEADSMLALKFELTKSLLNGASASLLAVEGIEEFEGQKPAKPRPTS